MGLMRSETENVAVDRFGSTVGLTASSWLITIAYCVGALWFVWKTWSDPALSTPDRLGSFLQGVFSPLASVAGGRIPTSA
jgi:hypothetical protein